MGYYAKRLGFFFTCMVCCTQSVMGATGRTLDEALRSALNDVCSTEAPVPPGLGPNLTNYCEDRKIFAIGIPSDPAGASGSSTSHHQSLQLQNTNARDFEEAEIEHGPWSFFASAKFEQFDKDLTKFEPAFDSNITGVVLGFDYQLREALNVGVAIAHEQQDGNFSQNGGQFDIVDTNFLIFGLYTFSKGGFIDAVASFTTRDAETTRRFVFKDTDANNALFDTDTLVDSDSNAEALLLGLRGGYDWLLRDGYTLGMRVALLHEQLDTDGFTESGDTALALSYLSQEEERFTSELSLSGSRVLSKQWGVIIPQFTFTYLHEFSDDQRDIRAIFAEDERDEPTVIRFSNDPPDRNYFRFNVGTSLNFKAGLVAFIEYSGQFGFSDHSRNAVNVGIRKDL